MDVTKEDQKSLIELADTAREHSYAPYSHYRVGAALRTKSGRIYTGVNVENAAYTNGICAERLAVFKAVADGERDFEVLALVTDNGGAPCGACRQVLSEFGLDTLVLIADRSHKLLRSATVGELLPEAFQPSDLGKEVR